MSEEFRGCSKCGNRLGFVAGTCIECGFNNIRMEYDYIKVSVQELPETMLKYRLIDKHDDNIMRLKDM